MFRAIKNSWIDAMDIYSFQPRVFIQREQLILLPHFGWDPNSLNISTCTEFLSIRLRDPSWFVHTSLPMVYFARSVRENTQIKFNKPLTNGLDGKMPHQFYASMYKSHQYSANQSQLLLPVEETEMERKFKIIKNRTYCNFKKCKQQIKSIKQRLRNNPNYTDSYQDLCCITFDNHEDQILFVK